MKISKSTRKMISYICTFVMVFGLLAGYRAGAVNADDTAKNIVDWSTVNFVSNGSPNAEYTDKYKVYSNDWNVTNVQLNGWVTSGFGIYGSGLIADQASVTFDGEQGVFGIDYRNEGAGLLLSLTALTKEYTTVLVRNVNGDVVYSIYVYYVDGIPDTGKKVEAPTNLEVTNRGLSVDAAWTAADGEIDHYEVKLITTAGDSIYNTTNTNYTFNGIYDNTSTVVVCAVDADGNKSDEISQAVPNIEYNATNTETAGTKDYYSTITTGGKVYTDYANRTINSKADAPAGGVSSGISSAAHIISGDLYDRWESEQSDPQYISIDLGADYEIKGITTWWQTASAETYYILLSDDGENWTAVDMVTSTTQERVDEIMFAETYNARYVRIHGTSRTTDYGYSIYEVGVYALSGIPKNVKLTNINGTTTISWQEPDTGAPASYSVYDKNDTLIAENITGTSYQFDSSYIFANGDTFTVYAIADDNSRSGGATATAKADLIVTDVTASQNILGVATTFGITIKNIGTAPANEGGNIITIGVKGDGWNIYVDTCTAAIAVGESLTVNTVSSHTFTTSGTINIVGWVDDRNQVDESDENNDFDFTVEMRNPDILTSDEIVVQGFQIKTNNSNTQPEGSETQANVAFRTMCKAPNIGSEITVNGNGYTVASIGTIYTLDPDRSGITSNKKLSATYTVLDPTEIIGQVYSYKGAMQYENNTVTYAYLATGSGIINNWNKEDTTHTYYARTMTGMELQMANTIHVRAFIVATDGTIIYGKTTAVSSVAQIANYLYVNSLAANYDAHCYLYNGILNGPNLKAVYENNPQYPYYRSTKIEYGWTGNLYTPDVPALDLSK